MHRPWLIVFIIVLPLCLFSIQMTVYNNDFAHIKEDLILHLEAGVSSQYLGDLPGNIDPNSLIIKPVSPNIEIITKNVSFDADNSIGILTRNIGKLIRVITEANIKLQGKLEFIDAYNIGITEVKKQELTLINRDEILALTFLDEQITLNFAPELHFEVYSETAGDFKFQISYLCSGISWEASYNMIWDEKKMLLEIDPWIRLKNESGSDFRDANIKLVAGEINRIKQIKDPYRMEGQFEKGNSNTGLAENILHDYNVYTLNNEINLKDQQTPEFRLFKPVSLAADKRFEYNTYDNKVTSEIRFRNSKESGMLTALPGGIARIYTLDEQNDLQFIGEDIVVHTDIDQEISLTTGYAYDIFGETKIKDQRKIDKTVEKDIEVVLKNRSGSTVIIAINHSIYGYWKVIAPSINYRKIDAKKIEFIDTINPGDDYILQWTEQIEQ
jgi:hypothetical protein